MDVKVIVEKEDGDYLSLSIEEAYDLHCKLKDLEHQFHKDIRIKAVPPLPSSGASPSVPEDTRGYVKQPCRPGEEPTTVVFS